MEQIITVGDMIKVLERYPKSKHLVIEVYLTAGWDGVHYDAVETAELENKYDVWSNDTQVRIGANET